MSDKKRILVFTDWFLPGFKAGGPIRSLTNMAAHLNNEFDFRFVTTDRDLFSETPYADIIPGKWILQHDGTRVIYLSPEMQNELMIKNIMIEQQADLLYLNSMFSRKFTLLPLHVRNKYMPARKVILAPRGMLGSGALRIKPLKKKIFLLYARLTRLYRNVIWHASSTLEAAEIKKTMGSNANVNIALNLSPNYSFEFVSRNKKVGELRLVFLSRISTKKNLTGTLKLLARVPSGNRIQFDIYGPIEDHEYWNSCKALISHLPAHIKVNYKGSLANEGVLSALIQNHISILLTFNENFGHSIVESLAAGCPVLISEHTPWKGLEPKKAGWDILLADEEAQLKALLHAVKMDQQEFDTWSRSAQQLAQLITEDVTVIEQNRKLFA